MESLKQGELVPGSFPPVHRSNVQDQDLDESISDYSDETGDEGVDTMDDAEETESETEPASSEDRAEEKETEESESSSGEHDGKYFVVQKGTCQCNQGFKFPKFKVASHQKHYWNDAEGQADYLAVTEDDLTLDPPAAMQIKTQLRRLSALYVCTCRQVAEALPKSKSNGQKLPHGSLRAAMYGRRKDYDFQTWPAERGGEGECSKGKRKRAGNL